MESPDLSRPYASAAAGLAEAADDDDRMDAALLLAPRT